MEQSSADENEVIDETKGCGAWQLGDPFWIKVKAKTAERQKELGRRLSWKEYQELHGFRETDYGVKANEWAMLDFANPAWQPATYRLFGKNLQRTT